MYRLAFLPTMTTFRDNSGFMKINNNLIIDSLEKGVVSVTLSQNILTVSDCRMEIQNVIVFVYPDS